MNRRAFLRAVCGIALAAGTSPARAAGAEAADVVREAIRRQRVLRLRYGGHVRLVEPHALGVTASGHRAVLAWQVEGGSRSEPPSGWRTFLLGEITDVALTERGFSPRPNYRPERANLRAIELEVTREPDAATNRPATGRG
ncbi:WYL domain-containing protein [Oleiharenicola sp. Vm1]|uniref:WYL domain-containing protein n=1 Tax=Oleiharenicola sp. Vm1 TaxID=3398393 RepID=UPI0039F60168